MDDGFLQIQYGGGLVKGFSLPFVDHCLKDSDLLWFQEAMFQSGLPA
jgi:hypothetical protein